MVWVENEGMMIWNEESRDGIGVFFDEPVLLIFRYFDGIPETIKEAKLDGC